MDKNELRRQAREEAKWFLENEQEYRMGYIEAELPHPLTRRLSQTCAASMEDGVRLLLSVDAEMAERAAEALASPEYARFAETLRETVRQGHRVVFSGCGSSGRLSMRLEQSWRRAIEKLSARYPQAKDALQAKLESVGNIMTGGDYAVIRAVESFEDSPALGKEQTRQWKLGTGDVLVGVTATGETTSILGTAVQALEDGAMVYMLICADPTRLLDKMARARAVYNHPGCRWLTLPCGPMALTGSTRMQSSTFEQLAGAAALDGALDDILRSCGVEVQTPEYGWYGRQFAELTRLLMAEPSVNAIAEAARLEKETYEAGGLVTIYAEEFLLDVLTDTTERAPTFMTPPFCPEGMAQAEQSWAFVKNPSCDTVTAWERCFSRQPRCIEWDLDAYRKLGFTEKQVESINPIGVNALRRFLIGSEPMPRREGPKARAMWVDAAAAPESFSLHAARYGSQNQLTLEMLDVRPTETAMDIYEHLGVKLMLNTLSTAVMAGMGRVHGNWMTSLAMSNKKLVDRSARIVSDVCGIPYERALEENFYSKAMIEEKNLHRSPVQETICRLQKEGE